VLSREIAAALGLSANATISPSPQGMTSEVAFVDDDGVRAVLKRCRDARYIEWLRREHAVLVAMEGCALNIPRAIGFHEVGDAGTAVDAWLLMTRLPGQSLWDTILGAAPGERRDYFRRVGNVLRELHATAAPAAFSNQAPWIDRMLARAQAHLSWCDGSVELLRQLEATQPDRVPEVMIHGDLALDNVLMAGDGTMGLIDWSGGDVGDPRYDIALALGTEPELVLGEAETAAFFDGYAGTPSDAATMRWFQNLYEFF
jgi:aminoglycoside phosphotransferase (APT) family kinase protein